MNHRITTMVWVGLMIWDKSQLTNGPCVLTDFVNGSPSIPQIMKEIQEHKIKIYEFPDTEDDEDSKLIRRIKVAFFFCWLRSRLCDYVSYFLNKNSFSRGQWPQ